MKSILNIFLLLSFYLIGSCATTDYKFEPYVQEFATEIDVDKDMLDFITINFESRPNSVIGTCVYGTFKIKIDPKYWHY